MWWTRSAELVSKYYAARETEKEVAGVGKTQATADEPAVAVATTDEPAVPEAAEDQAARKAQKELAATEIMQAWSDSTKRFLRVRHDAALTDAEVFRQIELPSPLVLLRVARLKYFGHLVACGDCIHWGLLRSDRRWCAQLQDDLRWLWTQLSNASVLLCPEQHFDQWMEIIKYSPKYWKRLVNRAARHDVGQTTNMAIVAEFRKEIVTTLQREGDLAPPPPFAPTHQFERPFACLRCRRQFRTRGGEGAQSAARLWLQLDICSPQLSVALVFVIFTRMAR